MLHDTGISGGSRLRHPDEREESLERFVPIFDAFGNVPPFGCQGYPLVPAVRDKPHRIEFPDHLDDCRRPDRELRSDIFCLCVTFLKRDVEDRLEVIFRFSAQIPHSIEMSAA